MKVTLEKEKENVVKLDITIPAKDAIEAYNNAVRKILYYITRYLLRGNYGQRN